MDTDFEHDFYNTCPDYNDWVDDNVVVELVSAPGAWRIEPKASLALFCGDNPAYMQGLAAFRAEKINLALGVGVLSDDLSSDNVKHFHRLLSLVKKQQVVPFIGAGMSASCGLPTWSGYIESQLRRMGMTDVEAKNAVMSGNFERLVDDIIADGSDLFERRFHDAFGAPSYSSNALKLLPKLFGDVIATTNYDDILETMFREAGLEFREKVNGVGDSSLLISALSNRTRVLFKIHGNLSEPSTRILSGSEYDDAYGADVLNLALPLTSKLRYLFQNRSLFFLGCSLQQDRTLSLFHSVTQEMGVGMVPEHFALLEAPASTKDVNKRENFLARMKITPVWYAKGEHSYIEGILSMLTESYL